LKLEGSTRTFSPQPRASPIRRAFFQKRIHPFLALFRRPAGCDALAGVVSQWVAERLAVNFRQKILADPLCLRPALEQFPQQGADSGVEFFGGHDLVDQPDSFRFFGAKALAAQEIAPRIPCPDSGQRVGADGGGQEPQPHFGETKDG